MIRLGQSQTSQSIFSGEWWAMQRKPPEDPELFIPIFSRARVSGLPPSGRRYDESLNAWTLSSLSQGCCALFIVISSYYPVGILRHLSALEYPVWFSLAPPLPLPLAVTIGLTKYVHTWGDYETVKRAKSLTIAS